MGGEDGSACEPKRVGTGARLALLDGNGVTPVNFLHDADASLIEEHLLKSATTRGSDVDEPLMAMNFGDHHSSNPANSGQHSRLRVIQQLSVESCL